MNSRKRSKVKISISKFLKRNSGENRENGRSISRHSGEKRVHLMKRTTEGELRRPNFHWPSGLH